MACPRVRRGTSLTVSRICTVCANPARRAIEGRIVSNVPNREIAEEHGLSETAVWRHRHNHVREALTKAAAVAETAHADDLLAKVRELEQFSKGILGRGIKEGDNKIALGALGELRQLVALFAKLTGEIDESPKVNAILLGGSSEWMEMQERLFRALQPFPEAREAAMQALTQGQAEVIDVVAG